jgi:hypothetical protein
MDSRLRTQAEIERAYDLLTFVLITDAVRPFLPEDQREGLRSFGLTLCWVLGHEHNTAFPDALAWIERSLEKQGLEYDPVERTLRVREAVQ